MTMPPDAKDARFQTGRVLTIGIAHAMHDTYTAFLAPLLPAFITALLLSKTEAGLLTVFLTAPSLLQPFIGHLADRVTLRYFVILAPCVTAVAMSFLGTATSYGLLALLLLVAGFSSASIHAVGPVMAGRLSGRSLGRGMGVWMVGGELGRALGPIVIVTAVALLTLEATPWLMIGGLVASAVLYVRLKDVPGRSPDAGQGLPWRRALRAMGPVLGPLTGLIIARAFILSALTTYLPIFLSEEGASLWFAGASLSVLEAAGVVGALLGGSLSDWLGRRWVLFVSTVATPLLMFLFLMVEGWLRFPLLVLMGFTVLSVTPVIMAVVQENFPENRALANGVYMALGFSLRSGAIVAMGALGDLFGLRLTFTISAAIGLLGLPFILLLPRKRSAGRLRAS
jgi:FSR family fosmidomycin resistance protein-like MFS transporter